MHARSTIGRLASAALAAWLVSAGLLAQQQQAAETPEFQSFQVPGWSFTPGLAVGVVRDSNVALASRPVTGTEGDTLFNVIPSAQLEYIGKRGDFSVGYRGFLRRYAEVEGLDGFDQRVTAGFRRAMSRRVSLFARNNYADSPTTDEVELNGVPFQRVGSQTNTLAAGVDVRLSKFTTLGTRYDMTFVDFERDESSSLTGGWVHGLRADVIRQVSARLGLGGEYSYRTASLDQGEREFGFQDAGGVLTYQFGPHTTFNAGAGFALLNDRARNDSRTGPYVRASVSHDLDRAIVGAGYERRFLPTFGFGGASTSQEVRGFVRTPLDRHRFYVQGSAAWRRSVPLEISDLELDSIWIRSTVGYSAARWARVEALYTYARQDSIITGGEVDRHRVGVQVVVSQPMRIR